MLAIYWATFVTTQNKYECPLTVWSSWPVWWKGPGRPWFDYPTSHWGKRVCTRVMESERRWRRRRRRRRIVIQHTHTHTHTHTHYSQRLQRCKSSEWAGADGRHKHVLLKHDFHWCFGSAAQWKLLECRNDTVSLDEQRVDACEQEEQEKVTTVAVVATHGRHRSARSCKKRKNEEE